MNISVRVKNRGRREPQCLVILSLTHPSVGLSENRVAEKKKDVLSIFIIICSTIIVILGYTQFSDKHISIDPYVQWKQKTVLFG